MHPSAPPATVRGAAARPLRPGPTRSLRGGANRPPRRRHALARFHYVVIACAVVLGALVVGVSSATTIRPPSAQVDHTVGLPAAPRTTPLGWAPQPSATALSPIAAVRSKAAAGSGVTGEASALSADGIPATALLAYQQAANTEQLVNPGCGLSWPLLAGIGRVESDHGRYGGATLYTDGVSLPKIIGIALNGQGTALILDTDHGRLDGDTVYDRAVGPMQFIPSTWAEWGVDGNYDGIIDPFNIFDAALTAAHYLCAAGGNLSTLAGQTTAVLTYNHSDAYVALVLSLEAVYAQGVQGLTVPVLPPTGPQPGATGVPAAGIPPADPGSALGVPGGSTATPSTAPGSTAPGGPTSSGSTSPGTTSPGSTPSGSGSPAPSSTPPTSAPPSTTSPAPSSSTCPPVTPGASTTPSDSPTSGAPTGAGSTPTTAPSQTPPPVASTSSAPCLVGP
jgi:membrane-bound lytic murein transglycosylase B